MIKIQDLQIFAGEADYLLFHNASYREAVIRVINVSLKDVTDPSKYQLHCYQDRIELFKSGAESGISYYFSPDEYDPEDENAADFELGVINHESVNI